jgi:hypothetical protein
MGHYDYMYSPLGTECVEIYNTTYIKYNQILAMSFLKHLFSVFLVFCLFLCLRPVSGVPNLANVS